MIPAPFAHDIFKTVRVQYNLLIRQVFEQSRTIPQQITYGRVHAKKYQRSHSYDSSSTDNEPRKYISSNSNDELLYSRYATDFEEIECLATGQWQTLYFYWEVINPIPIRLW
jgi:hypothetical protein